MKTGRPTNDPKSEVIRIRLNVEMKSWLESKSKSTGKSASQVIRDMIGATMNNKER